MTHLTNLRYWCVPLLITTALSVSPSDAQITGVITLDISIESTYFDDCDPGTNCLIVFCGPVEGTMTLEYVGFDGTFDNYDVTDVNWDVYRGGCPASVPPTFLPEPHVGSGSFQIDRQPIPSQRLLLDLSRDLGPDITIDSGFVNTTDFPNFVEFDLISAPTAEFFSITTSLASQAFVRGDVNVDGSLSLADPLALLIYLFDSSNPSVPSCLDTTDSNDDGSSNLLDALHTLSALFIANSPPPLAPYPDCGFDPTADSIGCVKYTLCP